MVGIARRLITLVTTCSLSSLAPAVGLRFITCDAESSSHGLAVRLIGKVGISFPLVFGHAAAYLYSFHISCLTPTHCSPLRPL